MIAQIPNLQVATVPTIMTNDLDMRRVCAKLVPKLLKDEQKAYQVTIANELSKHVQIESDFHTVLLSGTKHGHFIHYDPEKMRPSAEMHTAASPKQKAK